MTKRVGLWIDHRKTVIVTLSDRGRRCGCAPISVDGGYDVVLSGAR